MALVSEARRDRQSLVPTAAMLVVGALVLVTAVNTMVGSVAAVVAVAFFAYRARVWWLAACAAAWVLVFLAVLTFPGPYDSWAGKAVIPVLAGYALCFLGAWALGRRLNNRGGTVADARRPALVWPSEARLRLYLLALLVVAVAAAFMLYRGGVPPLFAANPDASRAAYGQQSNVAIGLMLEAWTLGLAISLLRALIGPRSGRWLYFAAVLVFTFGASLGASKNSVLEGIVPAVIAALSVRRGERRVKPLVKTWVVVLIGAIAVGAAVFLGGQRTMHGTGRFEDEFRAEYGHSAVAASFASLDLSLSSSAETFGRLWAQHGTLQPRYGAYSLMFLGKHAGPLVGHADLYGMTAQLSAPYYMNTATFAAIPLLDFGPVGAALMLAVIGLGVGFGERSLEFSPGPAQQLGRSFIVYYAAFGVYELYPLVQPIWLSIVPGLVVLHFLRRNAR